MTGSVGIWVANDVLSGFDDAADDGPGDSPYEAMPKSPARQRKERRARIKQRIEQREFSLRNLLAGADGEGNSVESKGAAYKHFVPLFTVAILAQGTISG